MVVGSGLVARSFKSFSDNPDILIFASGVSNSGTTDPDAYTREKTRALQHLQTPALFIYFSTVSVLYPCLQDSAYVRFKLRMEEMIRSRAQRYMIFRLPNLVGHTDNPFTLTNYLYHQITTGAEFEIHANATRYLLDVDDMVALCETLMSTGEKNTIHNIALENKAGVHQIVELMENVVGMRGKYKLVDKGCDHTIEPVSGSLMEACRLSRSEMSSYNLRTLRKYYGHNEGPQS